MPPIRLKATDLSHVWDTPRRPGARVDDFAMVPGESLFLEGPSGAGKSTLLAALAGVLRPVSGDVALDGVSYRNLSDSALEAMRADQVGFLFQRLHLVGYLTVMQNLMLPVDFSVERARRLRARGESPRAQARRLLERLGLEASLWTESAARLSVGQQQRVAAARALMGDPPLLVADEPTSALDPVSQESLVELLLEECSQRGAVLLAAGHDTRVSARFTRTLRVEALGALEVGV